MKGYLHKRGQVWYTTVDLPRLPGMPRKQREIKLGKMPKKEAQAKERDVLRQIEDHDPSEPRNATVADFLNDWLRVIAPTEKSQPVAPKNFERYRSIVNRNLIPHLGRVPLSKLQRKHIVDLQVTLRDEGYSGTTCLHVHRVLHTALNVGVRTLRMIKGNPASSVPAPKPTFRKVDVDEVRVTTLIAAAQGTQLEVPVVLAALSGLRRGELLALRWSRVDFDHKRLIVSESLEETKQFGLRFKAPKSGKVRVVPLAENLIPILRTHRDRQEKERTAIGLGYQENDLVFSNGDGNPWPPDTLSKQFASIASLVGLKDFRLHDLRHAFADRSISRKEPRSRKFPNFLDTPTLRLQCRTTPMRWKAWPGRP